MGVAILNIPARFFGPLSALLYPVGWPFLAKDRKVISNNLEHVFKKPARETKISARQVLRSQFLVYVDTLAYVMKRDSVCIEGREEFFKTIQSLERADKGIVVFTAHLGSWELAGHFCALATRRPMHVLAKPSKTKWVNPILDKIRHKLDMRVLWTDSKSLFRDMLAALNQGQGLGFVMDQKPAQKHGGIKVSFLGIPETSIVQGPALVIAKKNVAAVGAYCVRVGPRRFRLIASVAFLPDHGETDQEKISAVLAKNMETAIMQYPEQWAWNYRRWKIAK